LAKLTLPRKGGSKEQNHYVYRVVKFEIVTVKSESALQKYTDLSNSKAVMGSED
jgi:hypothetical protein